MYRRVSLLVGDDRRVLAREQCRRGWADVFVAETRDSVAYLRRLIGNPDMVARLRAMLQAVEGGSVLDRRTDQQIVEEIAGRIRDKRMCLDRYPIRTEPWPAPASQAVLFRGREPEPQQRAPAQHRRPTPQPEPSPQDEIDQDRQAETLMRAAENGTPFCEECQRDSAERAGNDA